MKNYKIIVIISPFWQVIKKSIHQHSIIINLYEVEQFLKVKKNTGNSISFYSKENAHI